MMIPKIFGIIFLILALGLGVYILRSGIIGKVESLKFLSSGSSSAPWFSFGAPNFKTPAPPSSYISVPPRQSGAENAAPPQSPGMSQAEIPSGFTAGELSPYFHKIRFGSVSPGSAYSYGQISLYAGNISGGESVDVSGWLLRADNGSQFVPKAVKVYDPSGLAAESDIYLRSGDFLNIYSSESAIGENLRLNECIGYLENYNQFIPALPLNCPSLDRSQASNFSGACEDYISSLGSCRLPAPNPPIPETDYACRSYLETINYKGCYDKHFSDPDFLSREVRAWSGSRFLDGLHDRLLLLDRNGLLVDLYEY